MLKAIEKLVTGESCSVGNHSVKSGELVDRYYYHNTAICVVNRKERRFYTDNGGWATSSTTRAINNYTSYLKSLGYSVVKKEDVSW